MRRALLVIDMLNDFVTGSIANKRSERIIPTIADLLTKARSERDDWLVAYPNFTEDDHESGLAYLEMAYKTDMPYTKELLDS